MNKFIMVLLAICLVNCESKCAADVAVDSHDSSVDSSVYVDAGAEDVDADAVGDTNDEISCEDSSCVLRVPVTFDMPLQESDSCVCSY